MFYCLLREKKLMIFTSTYLHTIIHTICSNRRTRIFIQEMLFIIIIIIRMLLLTLTAD